MGRLRAAIRTNDPQRGAVCFLTTLNVAAGLTREGGLAVGWWIVIVLMWPVVALLSNLFNPIPEE